MLKCNVLIILIVTVCVEKSDAECPNIITRDMWGSQLTTKHDDIETPVNYVIIQHTVSNECDTVSKCSQYVANIQNYHIQERKFGDIAYNFLIGGDGNVYEGRGWHKVGAHSKKYNKKSIGVAFIGNFSDELPSRKALRAAKNLLACGIEKEELSPEYVLFGHRQVMATQSPGTRLYHEIVTWPHWANTVKSK